MLADDITVCSKEYDGLEGPGESSKQKTDSTGKSLRINWGGGGGREGR